ncbi:ABC transporter permease [Saccharophagus degradans]|uniref:ABC transporter permease n=1 Tax=Saccharophagus degradans TaxID=86304 RepID=UPI001C09CA0E|nr:ABC transporter permease [Saccharophagus degradans]MBU2985622.1 ABC transporter permease [Saccharophagus degradans]
MINAIWSMVFKSLRRNASRNALQASLIFFSAFAMAYFAQFLAGVTRNYTDNLVHLASGDMFIASAIAPEDAENLFEREYEFLNIPQDVIEQIQALPFVTEVHPRIDHQVRVSLPEDTLVSGLSAFEPTLEPKLVRNFSFNEGRMINNDAYEVIVPSDLARRYQISVGNSLPMLARTSTKKMNLVNFEVVGIFETNSLSAWFNNYMYTSVSAARSLINDPTIVTRLNIHIQDADNKDEALDGVSAIMNENLASASVPAALTWWEDGAEFFTSLVFGIEAGFFIIVGVICTILACSMGLATIIGVIERTKEIATLGALGAPPAKIRKIFIMESVLLSDLSSLLGVGVAAIAFMITLKYGIPITNPELQGFLGASKFYPAFDIAGFIVPFLICKLVTANVSFLVATKACKRPITEALADR